VADFPLAESWFQTSRHTFLCTESSRATGVDLIRKIRQICALMISNLREQKMSYAISTLP